MRITMTREETKPTIALEGRLDTTSAPELEKVLKESLDSVAELTLDFAKLDYISSAGLRKCITVMSGPWRNTKISLGSTGNRIRMEQKRRGTNWKNPWWVIWQTT